MLGRATAPDPESDDASSGQSADDSTTNIPPAKIDLLETAAKNSDLSTFISAVNSADLAETLRGQGPFTVFAPNNQAFEKLPPETLTNLMKPENKAQLTSLLTYQIVPGTLLNKDLTDGEVLKTVEGGIITVQSPTGRKTLTDEKGNAATILRPDLEANNGVVHVTDTVLQPKTLILP